ncbi:MAG TPA: VOC family protein [Vicinamibacterales bacterium]|nr:VOC family protein [Vicinamibacterales bacterium]
MKTIAIAAIFAAGFGAGIWAAGQNQPQQAPSVPAERVTGIGGVFFKAKDPKTLRTWYQEKLGIALQEGQSFGLFLWRERQDPNREGTTVWGLFPETTKYFAPSNASFMLNYRVRNLEALLTQLRSAGVTVDGKVVEDFNGKFAWVIDPEGNKIELWEPKPGY